jgi:hypothetical protein
MRNFESDFIGLAKAACTHCQGLGVRPVYKNRVTPCNCVFRAVFRACYNRFRNCVAEGPHTSTVSLEFCRGRDGHRVYSRKNEEFMADFALIAKRTLDERQHQIFRFHFLLGANWKLCCQRLNMDRGAFFHDVYRIEKKLGKVFIELEPYPLFPLAAYFAGVIRRDYRPIRSAGPCVEAIRALPLSA